MQELEPGWWILASVDLTRLPAAARASDENDERSTSAEYSLREVSPPQLLLKQLQRAHSTFLLHHASSLNELHSRLGRQVFCTTLDRYWRRFVWDWDVLLHSNPSVDIYNATKLAGGGELGIGVGEEEWGSGEREVLEDFVRRTEGLVDVLVSRYGDEPSDVEDPSVQKMTKTIEKEPWLGTHDHARASDGIIFSGIGALSRPSLTTVSQWMDAVFRHGESAYGVGENPTSRPRQRRTKRNQHGSPANGNAARKQTQNSEAHPRIKSPRGRELDLRRDAMESNATAPGIPAPLIGSVERSLDKATANVQKTDGSKDRNLDNAAEATAEKKDSQDGASYFDPEKMMSYLTLGYGSAWTLNPKGFSGQKEESSPTTPSGDAATTQQARLEPPAALEELDPRPDVSDTEEEGKSFTQRLEQSIGKFLIGLSGDLENTEFEGDTGDDNKANSDLPAMAPSPTQRIVMRTLNVQLSKYHQTNRSTSSTMSEASLDSGITKLRVVLYTHQPFIFVFLFELQTPSLTIPGFYRSIHHQLGPLQKPLLRSTDPTRIPERIAMQMDAKHDGSSPNASGLYDLVYDPVKMTVRTTVPNIPVPGTLVAEGILSGKGSNSITAAGEIRTVSGSWYTLGIPIGAVPGSSPSSSQPSLTGNAEGAVVKTDWNRVEALNVHTQILNMHASTHARLATDEIERTVKTSRGWWIVWLRMPREPSGPLERASSLPASGKATPTPTLQKQQSDETLIAEMGGGEREAFLVRKSVDSTSRIGMESRIVSSGRWLTPGNRDVSGSSAGAGPTSAKGVVEGVGVDARKWVEGLSRLS